MLNQLAQLDPVQFVDKAAAATDRWLFLAAIVFIILAFLLVIKYLVKDRDKERDARSIENNTHQQWVETVYTENVKLTANVLVVMQETNALLRRLDQHLLRTEAKTLD
jgi:heme/copper-type cytochrome/quinol oxidase subunit 2